MRLTEALEHMPESQRRAILLREWQGLSYHEIADELELSQSAVETLIFRARRTLASNLEAEAKQPGALSRMRKALDGGMLLAAIKGLFEGGAAVKVAAVAVAASGTVVVATAPDAPVSKPAPNQQAQVVQAVTPVVAPVLLERVRPVRPQPVEAKLDTKSAPPAPTAVASAPEVQAPDALAPAPVAALPQKQKVKVKHEPKATPPGQAKKQEPAARSNGNSAKAKAKKNANGKHPSPAPEQAAPTPQQVVMPVEPNAAQGNGDENGKSPKK